MDKRTTKLAACTLVASVAITVGGIMIYNHFTKNRKDDDEVEG